MKVRNHLRKKVRVEMVPLVDAVFLLLVFFLYAVLEMTIDKGIPVNLPEVSASEVSSQKDDDYIVVGLTASGETYFNKEKISLDKLPHRVLVEKTASNGTIVVCLRGDRKAYHEQTVDVLDVLVHAGVTRVFFEVSDHPVSSSSE